MMKLKQQFIQKRKPFFLLLMIVSISVVLTQCTVSTKDMGSDLETGFMTPPDSAKPRVWWHWMNGNITKDGIRADLEWMHRIGIGGFQNFDAALRQLIDLQYISMGIVILLVFAVVAVGIACSFVIFIIKNIREYGIMKAMGVTSREMSFLIVMKIAMMNLIACAAGLFIGTLITWGVSTSGGINLTPFTSHNRYFTVSGIIYPRLTVFSLLAPPATALFFGLLSAVWPTALLARRKAADILRMI